MKVLVAEDNADILQAFCDILEKEGYEILRAQSGHKALEMYDKHQPDFVCLDIIMEDISGIDVCKAIRRKNALVPIVFITAKSTTIDKVLGLEVGADDYIVKPFDIHEVIARIRAITRRCMARTTISDADTPFHLGELRVFLRELRAERSGKSIDLSLREIKILRLFFDNKGKLVDRNTLLDHCWGAHIMPESRTVDWHISQLRKKIEHDPSNPRIIKTVHGAGYIFDDALRV